MSWARCQTNWQLLVFTTFPFPFCPVFWRKVVNFPWINRIHLKLQLFNTLIRLFIVPYFFVRSFRYTASYRHGCVDFQLYRGGGVEDYSSGGTGALPPKPPRPLSSFDTHARWQPVTQSARSRWSYGKIEDCEQSIHRWVFGFHTLRNSPYRNSGRMNFRVHFDGHSLVMFGRWYPRQP